MNKFLTFPGHQPIYLGDIDFMQQSVQDAFVQLLKGLTGQDKPKCILKEATPDSMGAIVFDGEVLPLRYFAGTVQGTKCYEVESTYDGARTFKDGELRQCYETRVVVVSSGSSLDEYAAKNFPSIESLLSRGGLQQTSGSVKFLNDQVSTTLNYSSIGDTYVLEGNAVAIEPGTITVLAENLGVNLPDCIRYFPVIKVGLAGNATSVITARLAVTDKTARISIGSTNFSADDMCYFSVNIISK